MNYQRYSLEEWPASVRSIHSEASLLSSSLHIPDDDALGHTGLTA